jgi:hypothetical protein
LLSGVQENLDTGQSDHGTGLIGWIRIHNETLADARECNFPACIRYLQEAIMKSMSFKLSALLATLSAVAALAGCAATQQQGREAPAQGGISAEQHESHHPQDTTAQPFPATGAGTTGRQDGMMGGQGGMMGQGGQMDMKSRCDMHERMKNARTSQERGAMMNETMKNMTPEMRQRHVEMMEQRCR